MPIIEEVSVYRILNSHVEYTNEYVIGLSDGALGWAASPRGETISIYEDPSSPRQGEAVVSRLMTEGVLDRDLNQKEWDAYLESRFDEFGRNDCYALSLAFHAATEGKDLRSRRRSHAPSPPAPPKLCLNILNGGRYAYTNPVLSDFPEYLLVARSDDLSEVLQAHATVQEVVTQGLLSQPKSLVSGNAVSRFEGEDPNRACIEFLLGAVSSLGLEDSFDLMIDASAGDLWNGSRYEFAVTSGASYSPEEFCDYWLKMARDYPLGFLEDPFREGDYANWAELSSALGECLVIGDNFYSSSPERIREGAARGYTGGAIIKPNQAGTVTRLFQAISRGREGRQILIASHRSISTESAFEATVAVTHGLDYIKIGPLLTDYSSVIRLNEIIRRTAG